MLLLQSVYVFSRLGRGRCAVVGGCVLGRLYGMTYVQVRRDGAGQPSFVATLFSRRHGSRGGGDSVVG